MKLMKKDELTAQKKPNRIAIYGDSGIGKTLSIATLPPGKVLLLDFERKSAELCHKAESDIDIVQFQDWSEVLNSKKELEKIIPNYDFIVVDSLTYLRDNLIFNQGFKSIMGGSEVMDLNKSQPFYLFLSQQIIKFLDWLNNQTQKPIIYLLGITKNKLGQSTLDIGDAGSITIPRYLDFVLPILKDDNGNRFLLLQSNLYYTRLCAERELLQKYPTKTIPLDPYETKSGLRDLLEVL